MEIIVDARPFFTPRPAGVARYVASISANLQRLGHNLVFVSNRKVYLPESINVPTCVVKEYLFFHRLPGTLFIMYVFPFLAWRQRSSLFWGGSFSVPVFGFKSVVTIHDLVAYEYPHTTTLATFIFGRLAIKTALRNATIVTTVSEFTKGRIRELFPNSRKRKIAVVRCAVDRTSFYRVTDRDFLESNLQKTIGGPFILAVGSIEPRKNIENLLRAFFRLKNEGYSGALVLVGGSEWKSQGIHRLVDDSGYRSSVVFTGFVDDHMLNLLYNGCDLFVFPTLYEGFGIPPLEAMLAQASIVCSIYTEIPNIIGNAEAVAWFDPTKDDLYLVIKNRLEKKSESQPYFFELPSWEDSAKKLSELFEGLSKG